MNKTINKMILRVKNHTLFMTNLSSEPRRRFVSLKQKTHNNKLLMTAIIVKYQMISKKVRINE